MNTNERKAHWENVFETKDTTKVGWYQSVPKTSLRLIEELNLSKSAKIIEIGSGDSLLCDHLLNKGYSDISLLDISEKALETIKKRLGEKAKTVTFLATDVTKLSSSAEFSLWHDRAVFHFLTSKKDINNYVNTASEKLVPGGYLILGTFSDNGPEMCSGLPVHQYSEKQLTVTFSANFKKINCFTENHTTPSGENQNFLFCLFQRK